MTDYTVHFGVVPMAPGFDSEPQSAIHKALMGTTTVSGYEFICGGDPFWEWGEYNSEHPAHVTTTMPLDSTPMSLILRVLIESQRDALVNEIPAWSRLIDYVVITDTEDYSENVWVYLHHMGVYKIDERSDIERLLDH